MSDQENKFSSWPVFDEEQREAVERVLCSGRVNYWTGEEVKAFEQEFAEHCQTRYAVAVANGTLALELALRSIGVGPGDEVVVPCRTFVATASAVVACGARPVVADIEADSQNISADTISQRLSGKTKAVIVVHLGGRPCEMDPILDLAEARGLQVIEDCAQAHGARYRGRPVGSMGVAGAYSFCQDKILSTGGEGGMLVTDDPDLWRTAWSYKDHGKCYDTVHSPAPQPGFRWLHKSFGTNWRMTEMQAAIGRVQLKRLGQWVEARRRNAARLEEACRSTGLLRVLEVPEHMHHSYYRYYAFAPDLAVREAVLGALREAGVPCFTGSCGEIYREDAFEACPQEGAFENAQRLAETSLAWQVDQTVSEESIERACEAIRRTASRVGAGKAA